MQIRSGKLKGKPIQVPTTKIRPSTDFIKQALMNTFRVDLQGARVLDWFAGTGAVALNALSEGALFATFVEKAPQHVRCLRHNTQALLNPDCFEIYAMDAFRFYQVFEDKRIHPYQWIFADPTYAEALPRLRHLHTDAMRMLSPQGFFVLEHPSHLPTPQLARLSGYLRTQKYGSSALSSFVKA